MTIVQIVFVSNFNIVDGPGAVAERFAESTISSIGIAHEKFKFVHEFLDIWLKRSLTDDDLREVETAERGEYLFSSASKGVEHSKAPAHLVPFQDRHTNA